MTSCSQIAPDWAVKLDRVEQRILSAFLAGEPIFIVDLGCIEAAVETADEGDVRCV